MGKHFADSSGEAQILAWYGLAAVYGLAAWLHSLSRQFLSLLLLGLGTMASAIAIFALDSSGVVTSLDWMLLGCAFALRLAASWHLRRTPGDDSQN
ncbi:MAG: hypothetical protein EOP82_30225 [Variovorax sp.]|nr:MAG: hypothetical protein EOP82_30225 [Variovorax sp.]